MYSTCLFCHGDLGKNAAIEHFPVGRRLAFDGAKGRLWVVCRNCERWNLTPLEERWEAIEECEREFRASKLRVSTDHVGLARLKEGLELVRIGEPQRPEMAAWRYGDQFGRRRRKQIVTYAGASAIVGGVLVFGPMLGIIGGGASFQLLNLINAGHGIYRSRQLIHVPMSDGRPLRVRMTELPRTQLRANGDGVLLRITGVRVDPLAMRERIYSGRSQIDITGHDAIRVAAALLPRLNASGGSRTNVSDAVSLLEESTDPKRLFRRAVDAIEKHENANVISGKKSLLKNLPAAGRLALEMATHEESERRALEGELYILEEAWREAEIIAGIADDMFLPASVDDDLERLKRNRDGR